MTWSDARVLTGNDAKSHEQPQQQHSALATDRHCVVNGCG